MIQIGKDLDSNNKKDIDNFRKLLDLTEKKIKQPSDTGSFWKLFEKEVYIATKAVVSELQLNWDINYIAGHKFPDIVAKINENKSFGIEVKTFKEGKEWRFLGGSIMESTRIENIERIELFCARQTPFEIRHKNFEECVSNVAITHSPRYILDLNLKKNEDIFSKINQSYENVRKLPNPFNAFRGHLIKQKEITDNIDSAWWFEPQRVNIDNFDKKDQIFANDFIKERIKFWKDISTKEKENYKLLLIILHPEVIESNFDNACYTLFCRFGVINPHLRDTFTAGGKVKINGYEVSHITGLIYKSKDKLAKIFKEKTSCAINFAIWKERIERLKKEQDVLKLVLKDIEDLINK